MNEQEAIETILYASAFNREDSPLTQSLDMAIKALEKQIPKKPKTIINEFDGFKIGNVMFGKGTKIYRCQCGCFITKAHDYCPKCGNKIDWTVEE